MFICFESFEEKSDTFPRVAVPMMFAVGREGSRDPELHDWLNYNGVLDAPVGLAQLRALHEAMREGRYVPSPGACNTVQTVGETIEDGGNCYNWAAVALAALRVLNYPARLSAFGDARDPHEHVVVAAWYAGAWRYLDAKGNQAGSDFLVRPREFERETIYRGA